VDESKKTCFVISPIGPEDSDIRQIADDFLELLVEPVLARYDFAVMRADKIQRPSTITADIIRLVQESDFCIIDLTNNNPNVFYECGRRHETGRPFIQMVRKGHEDDLPFDVAGIRTVIYDLSNPRTVLESQKKLQEWIDAMIDAGLESRPSGESLSTIAQAIERLERKVTKLLTSPAAGIPLTASSDDALKSFLIPPREAYLEALRTGNLSEGYRILERLKKVCSTNEYVVALGLLVSMGEDRALEMLDSQVTELLKSTSYVESFDDLLTAAAQVIQNYANNTGKFAEAIQLLDGFLLKILPRDDVDNETKAFVANKIGMIGWSSDEYDVCLRYTKQALELFPYPSYSYNLALAYERKNMSNELANELRRLSGMSGLDDDHKALLTKHGYEVRD